MKSTIEDVLEIQLKTFKDELGNLVPIESGLDSVFLIKRTFYVYNVPINTTRGKHAHYNTNQLLICISGRVEVNCFDGTTWKKCLLNKPNSALLIPKGLWAEEKYKEDKSVLLVLCDTNYEKSDYIASLKEFEKMKSKNEI